MSCPAANSIVRMDVTMGSLPDSFCPATLKELAEAIAARLIVTPNQANSSFASGPIEPSSNQGPWFKNCEELFVPLYLPPDYATSICSCTSCRGK